MRLREGIRPPDILAEYLRLNKRMVGAFLSKRHARNRLCPGCHANNPPAAFTKNGYVLVVVATATAVC